jgi:hypothetical protein
MSKATLLDLAEYKREVERLHGLIEDRRTAGAESGGVRLRDGRVPFREIEVGDELAALMNVEFSTHQEYGGQSVAGVNADLRHKSRLVSLVAFSELIKSDYAGDLWGLYKDWTGKIPDSRMYSILEKAFADEALLKEGQDLTGEKRVWFTDALIAEAGLPRKMLPEVVELFALYWKYFYPMDVRELFKLVKGGAEDQKRVRILPEEHERLKSIVDKCKEFPTALSAAISDLSVLMEALSEREDLQPLDLVDRPDKFEELCGINPTRIIRGQVALRSLAQRVSLAITPEKFRRIVLSLASGTRVILPSGRSVDTEEAGDVPFFGRYRIGAATHLVMPNELLPPEDVGVYPDHHLSTLGNRVIYKAKDEFLPLEGDAESPIIPRELWIEGRSRGFVWFRNRPTDRAVRVGKQHLFPDEGLHWRPTLRLDEDKLVVELSGVRLYDPKLTQKGIEITAGNVQHSDVWFPTDRNGLGSLSHAILPIAEPGEGDVEISLRNRRTAERLAVAGDEIHERVKLPPAMLFGRHYPVSIAPSDEHHLFGEKQHTLLSSAELSDDQRVTLAYEATETGKLGSYRVYSVTWKNTDEPLEIELSDDVRWRFERPIDLRLAFNGTAATDPFFKLPSGPDRIFRTWEDLSLTIQPELYEGEDRRVDLALYANDIFVAERSVEATSRLAGLKPGNSAFSGYQLRRGFGLGETASGQYRLELRRAGGTLSEFSWSVLPPLDVTDLPMEPFLEGEEVSFLVTSKVRCFPDDANRRRVVFGSVQVPPASLGYGEFTAPQISTQVPLERPRLNLIATFEPPVCGWRLYDDSGSQDDPNTQFLKKTTIARDDMAKYGLVIFASQGRHAAVAINDHIVKHLDVYEGYAFCELSDLIDRVTGRTTKLTPIVGDRRLATLTITWTPRVFQFERVAEYILDNALRFSIAYEGPQGDVIRLLVKDPEGGRTLAREELVCEGRMERREGMELKVREDLAGFPVIAMHGMIPSIGPDHEFGSLEFFNQDRDIAMKKLMEGIGKEPSNPDSYWSRAELYRSKGLLDLAVKDYEKAIELGLRDTAKRKRAEETIAQQDWMLLQQEIQALANHFVPFCRKELHLEY